MRGITRLFAGLLFIGVAAQAHAGEVYRDSTGFAASGRDVVAYQTLPAGQTMATPGKASITASWNGATYAFASEANRQRFVANPQAYAPQYDGHCAWAAAQGYKAPASPDVWRIVNGKLYLNYSHKVREVWETDVPGFVQRANARWSSVSSEPAATGDAEDYRPDAAPLR
jgi:YHS domain-containing protein